MSWSLRSRRRQGPARYSFFVWENGRYEQVAASDYLTDNDAAQAAVSAISVAPFKRPVTLEAPHMHVIREDGVHIITLEISEEAAPASGGMFFRDPPAGQEPAEKSPKPALQL